jgi:GlpG protein
LRQIGTITDETRAKVLADHLLTLGITTRIDATPAGWLVWVHREDKVDQSRAELDAFLKNPDDPKYHAAEINARALRREAERKQREHERNTIHLRGNWTHRPFHRCRITYFLLGASILITVLTSFGQTNSRLLQRLTFASPHMVALDDGQRPTEGYVDIVSHRVMSDPLADLRRGEIWRPITPIFLHFGAMHLLFNMLWLYDVGGTIELRRGPWRYAALVLGAAVLSNLGQYVFTRSPLFGGMSGVDYAFFGYVWMKDQYEPELGMRLRPDTIVLMLIWLGLGMIGAIPHVANGAHVVGLVVGIVAGIGPHLLSYVRR